MNAKITDIWETFCPLRATVRTSTEGGGNCEEKLVELWKEQRNHIVANYYYLVQRVAEAMHVKITEVEEDALASMGVDGLYDAVDGFEPDLNIKFETYAVYRIRGSILDAIRREDWVPRLVRQRSKQMREAHEALEARHGRTPTDEEMAEELRMGVDEYRALVDSSAVRSVQSLNCTFSAGGGDGGGNEEMSMMDCICDQNSPEPIQTLVAEELKSKLFGKNFTKLELKIIDYYYYDGWTMKEIAEEFDLSESRVSQIHTDIIERVQEKIDRNPEYFSERIQSLRKLRAKAVAAKGVRRSRRSKKDKKVDACSV